MRQTNLHQRWRNTRGDKIMKILDTLKSANSNLARNKVRTTLTIIAIFVGAFTLALTTGINTGVNRYIDAQLGSIGGENTLIIMPKPAEDPMDSLNSDEAKEYKPKAEVDLGQSATSMTVSMKPMSEATLNKVREINGIESVSFHNSPSVDFITSSNTNKKFVVTLNEVIPGITADMEVGVEPNSNSNKPEISIEPKFVESLGFSSSNDALGQEVSIGATNAITGEQKTIKATITGVQAKSLMNDGMSYVNPALTKQVSEITRIGTDDIPASNFAAVAVLQDNLSNEEKDAIKNKLSNLGLLARTVDDQIGVIRSVINAVTGVLTMFAAIALFAASFGIINTLYMAVQERTREIGLMKAMGLSNAKVFITFSLEAIMIGFWGSVLGIGAAMLAGIGINNIAQESFLGDLTGFTLVQFSAQNIAIIIGIICVIAFLAGTLPAVRASKLNPIEALRYE